MLSAEHDCEQRSPRPGRLLVARADDIKSRLLGHFGTVQGLNLAHAYGAALDDPDLTVVCVVRDGEAETGPLARAWHGNKFLDPRRDGMALPILHLNGWKIANPTLLARIPEQVDGQSVKRTWRSHQVPLGDVRDDDGHLRMLEEWLRSYRPGELFDDSGLPREATAGWGPRGTRRMSAIPQSNGRAIRRALDLPVVDGHAVLVDSPGGFDTGATEVLGGWFADVIARNPETFRIFSPDELESNRLAPAVFEGTEKQWSAGVEPVDEHLAPHGRVMEVLSEHLCQGWLEGYTLTGRHGVFTSYEAFIHIVDSMFNQHAKWLEACAGVEWREPLPAFTYLLSSHVWQQDHNGFTHQDPGFIDHVLNKSVVRRGIGKLPWAGTVRANETPDVVLAAAGDVPTQEVIAAAELLRDSIPELGIRVGNVVDLATLQSPNQHPAALDDGAFDALFTTDRPVVFAYHGRVELVTAREDARRHTREHGVDIPAIANWTLEGKR